MVLKRREPESARGLGPRARFPGTPIDFCHRSCPETARTGFSKDPTRADLSGYRTFRSHSDRPELAAVIDATVLLTPAAPANLANFWQGDNFRTGLAIVESLG